MANFTTTNTSLNDTLAVNKPSTPPVGITIFHAGLNIFLSITATLGNTVILIALQKVLSIHPPTKLLFRCLVVTDLLVGLILHPVHIIGLILDYLIMKTGHGVDDITFVLSFMLCGMSILISTAISVDRLLALFLKMRYKQVVTLRRVRIAIFSFVLVVFSLVLVYFFTGKLYALFITLVLIIFAVVISTFSYIKIYFRLRHLPRLQSNVHQGQVNGEGIPLNMARFKRRVASIAWVQLALIACYAPFGVCLVMIKLNDRPGIRAEMIWTFSGTLVFLNSSLNPCLYCWKLREMRQAVKAILTKHLCCTESIDLVDR